MDIRRLRYFVEIAEAGSITQAASRAGVAQPAVSQQLATLERELGVQLIERSAHGAHLTAAGHVLYNRVRSILRQIDELKNEVQGRAQGLTGAVSAGIPATLNEVITLPLLEQVAAHHPGIRLRLHEGASSPVLSMLSNGDVDLAIAPRLPVDSKIVNELLFTEPLLLAAPLWMEVGNTADFISLSKLPWLTTLARNAARALLETAFAQAGVPFRPVAEIDSLHTMVHAVRRGVGVTVLPRAMSSYVLSLGEIKLLPLGNPPIERPMFLCRRSVPLEPASQVVHDLIVYIAAAYVAALPHK